MLLWSKHNFFELCYKGTKKNRTFASFLLTKYAIFLFSLKQETFLMLSWCVRCLLDVLLLDYAINATTSERIA